MRTPRRTRGPVYTTLSLATCSKILSARAVLKDESVGGADHGDGGMVAQPPQLQAAMFCALPFWISVWQKEMVLTWRSGDGASSHVLLE